MEMYRSCMICNTHYGCYKKEKQNCHTCRSKECPTTSNISHGICSGCLATGYHALMRQA